MSDIVERLNKRTVRSVPANWQDGRECPECGVGANRPKCFYDMGGSCPRHDPDNYEPSPYVTAPDPVCAEAAATITALIARVERAEAALHPFAHCIDKLAPGEDIADWQLADYLNHNLTVRHVLTALAALEAS